MEYAKKYRWALAGFIILLLLNIGTLATVWMIRPPQQTSILNDERPRRVQRFLERELELNQQQRTQIQQLRQQHMQRIRSVMEDVRKNRAVYFNILQTADTLEARGQIDSLARRIGHAHAELERANYDHFRKIRQILNENQRSRFDRILEQSMQGPQRRGREPRPGNRHR
ncbi:periplasmic heavy metal sensor [Halalkalibaculum sp. DA3122]|uniref:periplasmic heavy metal sensor n=1 Tax=Halalkalibaculum sp. DA3122 TaxID=3373607 RepID=UPI003754D8B1